MGRKPSPIWHHFTKCPKQNYRTDRAKGNYCATTISAKPANLRTHFNNCLLVPRSTGALLSTSTQQNMHNQDLSFSATGSSGSQLATQSSLNKGTLSHLYLNVINQQDKHQIDRMFAKALLRSGAPFDFFENSDWHAFWSTIRPNWNPPSASKIGNELLNIEYDEIMGLVFSNIKQHQGGILGIDGATNVISKSISNVIIHTPLPLFVEFLTSDLKKETSAKVLSTVRKIEEMVGTKCVYGFISDSCNVMKRFREIALQNKLFKFAYGCSTHCLHNITEDLGRRSPIAETVKKALFVSKTVKFTGIIRKLYESICTGKYGRVLVMVMYSKSRWSSVNLMFGRLLKVKAAITYIPYALLHERVERGVDEDFVLPTDFHEILTDTAFWGNLKEAYELFDPICKCIGVLEGDGGLISYVYACFLCVRIHLETTATSTAERSYREERLLSRLRRIYSPIHGVAFYCDPFSCEMRSRVTHQRGESFVGLGYGSIVLQCHGALKLFAENNEEYTQLMFEFMSHWSSPHQVFTTLKNGHPSLVWGQLKEVYPKLSHVLSQVYKAPSSTTGVERNHKVAKRIHSTRRGRTGALKVERQTIGHNATQLKREVIKVRRGGFENAIANVLCDEPESSPPQTNSVGNAQVPNSTLNTTTSSPSEEITELDQMDISGDELHLENMLEDIMNSYEIGDYAIFNDLEL